ncbi:MAG: DUF948 domain-containing protein [Proteobacteria bacterium]|nr:DUF948 domain-containing protein [Pseudomonadota bacterium]MBU1712954.1 DUF948 domain-containing protein [Pseudomonadota bacterium]
MEATALLIASFILVVITFLATVFFLIYSFIHIKKAGDAITAFIAATELKIDPVLKEAEETLKSIRAVSDDIGSVTSSVKDMSGTISELAFKIKTLGLITDGIQNKLSVRISALKAGIKAATGVLLNH